MKREERIEFQIELEKAVSISKILLDQFYNNKGFFKDYSMPEYILPGNMISGSREHALWLTFVVSVDYMADAVRLWKNARADYEL